MKNYCFLIVFFNIFFVENSNAYANYFCKTSSFSTWTSGSSRINLYVQEDFKNHYNYCAPETSDNFDDDFQVSTLFQSATQIWALESRAKPIVFKGSYPSILNNNIIGPHVDVLGTVNSFCNDSNISEPAVLAMFNPSCRSKTISNINVCQDSIAAVVHMNSNSGNPGSPTCVNNNKRAIFNGSDSLKSL